MRKKRGGSPPGERSSPPHSVIKSARNPNREERGECEGGGGSWLRETPPSRDGDEFAKKTSVNSQKKKRGETLPKGGGGETPALQKAGGVKTEGEINHRPRGRESHEKKERQTDWGGYGPQKPPKGKGASRATRGFSMRKEREG